MGMRASEHDVVIMGGGLSGLTLARQLKDRLPQARILVADKQSYPVPEAAYKVGESTSELGGTYLADVAGLKSHLKAEHIQKVGLRFFCHADDKTDLTKRVELGFRAPVSARTYQIDRGKLENHMVDTLDDEGVEFVEGCRIDRFELGPETHEVTLNLNGTSRDVRTKWLVDATGRAGLLRRKLGLQRPVRHRGDAAWFRLADEVHVDDWSQDPHWQGLVEGKLRWRSTNHLAGPGYWAWLIPLSSGSTSIGVVSDPRFVDFENLRRFEPLMEWMRRNEPQLADHVAARSDRIQDFKTLKNYPYAASTVFSPDRWFLTGDAAGFLDPLYSPGTDFTGLANSFITSAIVAAESGDPEARAKLEFANQVFKRYFAVTIRIYADQYGVFGDPQVTVAKAMWDTAIYLLVAVLLFVNERFTDLDYLTTIFPEFQRYQELSVRMPRFLRKWAECEVDTSHLGFLYFSDAMLQQLWGELEEDISPDELRRRIRRNVSQLESMSQEMISTVTREAGFDFPSGLEPGQRPDPDPIEEGWLIWAERPRPYLPTPVSETLAKA
jgi:flavin-dependent dehydrogenase